MILGVGIVAAAVIATLISAAEAEAGGMRVAFTGAAFVGVVIAFRGAVRALQDRQDRLTRLCTASGGASGGAALFTDLGCRRADSRDGPGLVA